ncbi:hypothetical protein Tco_1202892 [Tanacetum coccineum]
MLRVSGSGSVDVRIAALSGVVNFVECLGFIARICTGCLGSGSVDVRIAALSGVVNFVQCLGRPRVLEEGSIDVAIEFMITLPKLGTATMDDRGSAAWLIT